MDFSGVSIEEYLKQHDIKPSYQRMRVFEYLIKYRNHPTADDIYRELVKSIPTLSRTTVYNILDLFVEKGITQLISIEENEKRYDADVTDHGHFKCEKCGRIYDFPVDLSSIRTGGLDGFMIRQKHIYFRGVCKKCSGKV